MVRAVTMPTTPMPGVARTSRRDRLSFMRFLSFLASCGTSESACWSSCRA